jgi:hypothetical protein
MVVLSCKSARYMWIPAKVARQNFEKKGKSKDTPVIHFIHPKVKKYIQKCLIIAPTCNVIKINSIPK